jgi:hypothetical protein
METIIVPAPFPIKAREKSVELMRTGVPKLRVVWFFASENEATTFRNQYLSVERPYSAWLDAYRRTEALRIPIAELISIGDSGVFLARNAEQHITREVLAGVDPTGLAVVGLPDVRLLDFRTRADRPGGPNNILKVYAKTTGDVSEDVCAAALRYLANRLPFRQVFLYLRTDGWFINDPAYPVLPPFEESPPPAREQFIASKYIACSSDAGRVRCITTDHGY